MPKHIADKRSAETGERLKRFTEIERDEAGPRAQTKDLQQRPRGERDDGARAKEYVRIERGNKA